MVSVALLCSGTQGGGLRLPWLREGGPSATSRGPGALFTAYSSGRGPPVARGGCWQRGNQPWLTVWMEEPCDRGIGKEVGQAAGTAVADSRSHGSAPRPVALIRFVLRRTGLQSGVAWGGPTPLCRPRKYPDLPGQAGKIGSHFAENWLPHIFCFNQARNI